MNFKQLLLQFNHSKKAYDTMYYLSKKVKNINQYLNNKNHLIDFPIKKFQEIMNNNLPLERIVKKCYFWDSEFELLNSVFCPRNETEELINILNDKNINKKWNYIDLCSGTGVIGITILKKNKNLKGTFLDISGEAIKNIKINLKKHKIIAKVVRDDWFQHLLKNDYEVISANFPYVGLKDNIESSVIKHEPKIAIYSRNGGWEHYDRILRHMQKNKVWKIVMLECNEHHEKLWYETRKKLKEFNFEFFRDIKNHLRFVFISREGCRCLECV